VNRGRYLRVESVMEAGVPKTTTSTMKLRSGTTLEAAALELTTSGSDAAVVVDGGGAPIGKVSLRQITSALSSA
ncbi:MAG: proline/glycine betaine ABC transporter ATP-binding protein, partial [Alphaproteobacteria bacterium]|nr:proline/glycine betaine ABC transporter ATP-binding protein [Alphaproteobacteria bacterium]